MLALKETAVIRGLMLLIQSGETIQAILRAKSLSKIFYLLAISKNTRIFQFDKF